VGKRLASNAVHIGRARQVGVGAGVLRRFLCARQKRGRAVGLTRKGKGTKWMLVTDGNGLPLGFHLDSAQKAEVNLAEQTLAQVHVQGKAGRPKTRPVQLVADRGYDSAALRQRLRARGIGICIPPRRRPKTWKAKQGRPVTYDKAAYGQRYKVERTFAWLGNCRRLLVRWERHVDVYRAFFTFAVMLLCINNVLK